MKKVFAVLLLSVLFIGASASAAFAHCGGRGAGYYSAPQAQPPVYAVCSVEGCEAYGLHEHEGIYYHCHNYGKHGYGYGHNYKHGGSWHR